MTFLLSMSEWAWAVFLLLPFLAWLVWLLLRTQSHLKEKTVHHETLQLRFDSICRFVSESVIITNRDDVVLYTNDRAQTLPGLNLRVDHSLQSSVTDSQGGFQIFLAARDDTQSSDGTTRELQTTVQCGGRTYVIRSSTIRHNDQPAGRIWTLLEITSHQRTEEELVHNQKMETVGRLATGIAHEFNNLLLAIQGNLDLAATTAEQSGDVGKFLHQAQNATERATGLSRELLDFSRKTQLKLTPCSANDLVDGVKNLLVSVFDQSILVSTQYKNNLWKMLADNARLEQVLLNLCINARDAILSSNAVTNESPVRGRIRLETSNVDHPARGECIAIRVTDNGPGIPADVKRRIFEPFFTTKATGRGTGLGLTIARGIIDQHRGELVCRDEPSGGTTFEIIIPRFQPGAVNPVEPYESEGSDLTGSAKIVLVDNEQLVRTTTCRALRIFGYKVVDFESGEDAMTYLDSETPDAVIMDLYMPSLSGEEFLKRLRSKHSDLPVLVASGFPEKLSEVMASAFPPNEAIQKPYSPVEMLRKLQNVLEVSGVASAPSDGE